MLRARRKPQFGYSLSDHINRAVSFVRFQYLNKNSGPVNSDTEYSWLSIY